MLDLVICSTRRFEITAVLFLEFLIFDFLELILVVFGQPLLFDDCQDLASRVTQIQLVCLHLLMYGVQLIILVVAANWFLAVDRLVVECGYQVTTDRIHSNPAIFKRKELFALIYENEGFWCIEVLDFF